MKSKNLYFVILLLLIVKIADSQSNFPPSDSIPILITDTSSYNFNPHIMVSSESIENPVYEDNTTKYNLFYEKQIDSLPYSSIWCRELISMLPESIFLSSNDSIFYKNPQPANSRVIFYEEHQDSTVKIKGILINPSTLEHLDSTIVISLSNLDKFVANSNCIFWIVDSVLYKQSYTVVSNTITLNDIDTVDNNTIDICTNSFWEPSSCIYEHYDYLYLTQNNLTINLHFHEYYSDFTSIIDSGNISNIYFKYNLPLYIKNNKVYQFDDWYYSNCINATYNLTDTLVPKHVVYDRTIYSVKDNLFNGIYAYTSDTFPNVINYTNSPMDYTYILNITDTFYYSENGLFYSYPFAITDTIRNLIMQRGYNISGGEIKENLVLEVGSNNRNALYLLRTWKDCGLGEIAENKTFNIKLFPNPANNFVYIQSADKVINSIELFDFQGKSIKTLSFNSALSDYSINISKLKSGMYFIKVKSNNSIAVGKFIKE